MDERQTDPPTPPLGPHRGMQGVEGSFLAGRPEEAAEPTEASWFAASDEESSLLLEQGGRALAEQTSLLVEQMAPTLAALPARLQSVAAPEEAMKHGEALRSLLLALPQQMASGQEASLAQVDGVFFRLLNTPTRPGLIAQVIDALAASSQAGELHSEQEAQIEGLRALHRGLVTLHQAWEAVREATLLELFPQLATPLTALDRQAQPADPVAAALPNAPPAPAAMPSPAEGVVAQPVAGKTAVGSFLHRPGRRHRQRLVLMLALLALVIASAGVLLLQGRGAPAVQDVAKSSPVTQRPPSATATSPIQLLPTPTPPAATSTARPSTPAPQPTPSPSVPPLGEWHCPSGSAFCVSTEQVDLPCSGDGHGTFQVLNAMASKAKWRASFTPGPDGTQVTIAPRAGNLKPADVVTLTVSPSMPGQQFEGTISIVGPEGTTPITVAVHGCSA